MVIGKRTVKFSMLEILKCFLHFFHAILNVPGIKNLHQKSKFSAIEWQSCHLNNMYKVRKYLEVVESTVAVYTALC